MARREFTITKFRPDPVRKYVANVTHASGFRVTVDYQYGSWQATVKEGTRQVRKEVLPPIAAVLTSRLPRSAR